MQAVRPDVGSEGLIRPYSILDTGRIDLGSPGGHSGRSDSSIVIPPRILLQQLPARGFIQSFTLDLLDRCPVLGDLVLAIEIASRCVILHIHYRRLGQLGDRMRRKFQ